ncbi:hypothetical protein PMIN06_008184 [Paraphaeosphaeria minitans]
MPTVDSSYTIKTTYLRACLLNVLRECPRRAADRPHLHHLHHSCPLAAPLFSHWLTRLAPARPSTISSLFQSTPLLIISTEPTATPRAHQLDVHSYAIQVRVLFPLSRRSIAMGCQSRTTRRSRAAKPARTNAS